MSNTFNSIKVTTHIENQEYLLETGKLANQAHGGIWVQSGDTVVLVTAVTQPSQRELDFVPLVVDYQEMSYASGRIPGSYFRREIGRPSERETLVSRMIDRPVRPLFPQNFKQEVQIIATVLSAEPDKDPDVLAITGASAALHVSKIPFLGPIAGGRVAYVDGHFIFNPNQAQLAHSQINLVLAAAKDAVVMVEGEAEFASEDLIARAISWGQQQIQPLLQIQEDLRQKAGQPKIQVLEIEPDLQLQEQVRKQALEPLQQALGIKDKNSRKEALEQARQQVQEALQQQGLEDEAQLKSVPGMLKDLEAEIVRSWISNKQQRIDGRGLDQVRELAIEVGSLPRVHGSSIFGRGETKALGVTTLGGTQDEQHIETLTGEQSKRFMLHYNFPPYCVGEVKMMRGPARREIGHGALAERSL
ncbi:MAG: polyribonucleotide nucleotidyltransferase, partial [Desulfohalobiaceae bacterium]